MKKVQIHHPGLRRQVTVFEPAVKHHLLAGWREGALPDVGLQEPAPQGRIRTNLTAPKGEEPTPTRKPAPKPADTKD